MEEIIRLLYDFYVFFVSLENTSFFLDRTGFLFFQSVMDNKSLVVKKVCGPNI